MIRKEMIKYFCNKCDDEIKEKPENNNWGQHSYWSDIKVPFDITPTKEIPKRLAKSLVIGLTANVSYISRNDNEEYFCKIDFCKKCLYTLIKEEMEKKLEKLGQGS